MPYIKPEALLALQAVAHSAEEQDWTTGPIDKRSVGQGLSVCAVCGDYDCGKSVVKANGVFVHPEDVADGDEVNTAYYLGDGNGE